MPLPLTEKIALSIPADMKDWLATRANLENVSMAYLVRCLIEKEMGLQMRGASDRMRSRYLWGEKE